MSWRSPHFPAAFRLLPFAIVVVAIAIGFASVPSTAVAANDDHDEAAHGAADHGDEEHVDHAEPGEHGYTFKGDLPFWGIVTFLLFLWVAKKMLWPWWTSSMAEREQLERQAIEQAEEKNRTAAALLTERRGRMEAVDEEIREILAEANRDAEHTSSTILADANREAELATGRAVHDIERRKDQALVEIFDRFTNEVVGQTESRLRGRLNESTDAQLIDRSLDRFAQQ